MELPPSSDCAPLSLTRSIAEFPLGNIPLWQHQQTAVAQAGLAPAAAAHLTLHPHAWLAAADLTALAGSAATTLVDASLTPLAWRGAAPDPQQALAAAASFLIRYPWDVLRANEEYVAGLTATRLLGEVHASAVLEGVVQLGLGSRILPGVFIEGNVVVGAHCKIGPNCHLRGNTSIGAGCHIGQAVEIKNCLILSRTSIGHLSYLGDSVVGEAVNFGAATTIANLRHDGHHHRSMVAGRLVDTGRSKFGAIIGDGVHTGIHTVIYPGRKLWPHTSTRPAEIVQRDVVGGDAVLP
jgi:bifunctional UDP-N-acetylglucosamine pyrophosphorylase/glucosamine-1-phosphate N-acetyltransferase